MPSYIKLGPEKRISTGNEAHDEDEERTVYGGLFEQPDPWNTVGFIIRLPASQKFALQLFDTGL